jgi:hypothetical protein
MKTTILLLISVPLMFGQVPEPAESLTAKAIALPTKGLSTDERLELMKAERSFLEAANIAEAKMIELQNAILNCEPCAKAQKASNDAQAQFQQANQKFVSAKDAAGKKLGCELDRDYACLSKPPAVAPAKSADQSGQ